MREMAAQDADRLRLFRAPARVNIIGEHTDYNDGFVLPTTTAIYTWLCAAPRSDRKVEVTSYNVNDTRNFDLDDLKPAENVDWLEYVSGVAAALEIEGIRLDQMGVGGDDSWGKGTLQKCSLNETQYNYRFTLLPYAPLDGRLDELVSR